MKQWRNWPRTVGLELSYKLHEMTRGEGVRIHDDGHGWGNMNINVGTSIGVQNYDHVHYSSMVIMMGSN